MSTLQLTMSSPASNTPLYNRPLEDVLLLPSTKRYLKKPDRMMVKFMVKNISKVLDIAFSGGNKPETAVAQQILMMENPTINYSVLIDGFLSDHYEEIIKKASDIDCIKFSVFISILEFAIITFPETSATTMTFFPQLANLYKDYRVDMLMSKIFEPQPALTSFYNFVESTDFLDQLIQNKAYRILSYTQRNPQLHMSEDLLQKVLTKPVRNDKDHWMLLEQLSLTDVVYSMSHLISHAMTEIEEHEGIFTPSQVYATSFLKNILMHDSIVADNMDPTAFANILVHIYETNCNHTIALTTANSLVISALSSRIVRPYVCDIFFRFVYENLTSNRRILVAFLTCLTEKITSLCKSDREISSEVMSTYYSKMFVDIVNEAPSDPEEIFSGYSHSARLNIIPFDAA